MSLYAAATAIEAATRHLSSTVLRRYGRAGVPVADALWDCARELELARRRLLDAEPPPQGPPAADGWAQPRLW